MIALTFTSLMALSLVCSMSYLIISLKVLGPRRFVKLNVWLDILFTFGIPALMMGTFAGLSVSFLAGLEFTIFSAALANYLKQKYPEPIKAHPKTRKFWWIKG